MRPSPSLNFPPFPAQQFYSEKLVGFLFPMNVTRGQDVTTGFQTKPTHVQR